MYANVKGLAQVCVNAWIIDSTPILEDFVRGFNGKELYFDFVDAKDRADGKLQGMIFRELT